MPNKASNLSEINTTQQAAQQPVPTKGDDAQFERLISAKEAALLLNVSTTTLLRSARRGEAPHLKLGRRVAFRLTELNRWLQIGTYNGEAVCVA